MISQQNLEIALGLGAGLALVPVAKALLGAFTVSVEEGTAALVTRFGRLAATLDRPGLHILPSKLLPWITVRRVSQRRAFRHIHDVHVNDARGTTVLVDLWLELRVTDPAKAVFGVADWERSLVNLVTHAAISTLGNREFQAILADRSELGKQITRDIADETARWGVHVEAVFIRDVSLLPDVSRQVFERVAARLERAKAEIEEEGRQGVALLDAETSAKTAALLAEAKGKYPAAIGRVYDTWKARPRVLAAYEEIYGLALRRPHRTVFFEGFEGDGAGKIGAAEAAMLAPPLLEGAADGAGQGTMGFASGTQAHTHAHSSADVRRLGQQGAFATGPTHGAGWGVAHFGGAVPHGHAGSAHFAQGHTPGYAAGMVGGHGAGGCTGPDCKGGACSCTGKGCSC